MRQIFKTVSLVRSAVYRVTFGQECCLQAASSDNTLHILISYKFTAQSIDVTNVFHVFLFMSRFFRFVTFFYFFSCFLVLKMLSKAKYELNMQKSIKKHAYRMHQQWFLLILVCYAAHTAKYLIYLLKSADVTQMQILTEFFHQTFTNVFIFPRFLHFFIFYLNVFLHLWLKVL